MHKHYLVQIIRKLLCLAVAVRWQSIKTFVAKLQLGFNSSEKCKSIAVIVKNNKAALRLRKSTSKGLVLFVTYSFFLRATEVVRPAQ